MIWKFYKIQPNMSRFYLIIAGYSVIMPIFSIIYMILHVVFMNNLQLIKDLYIIRDEKNLEFKFTISSLLLELQ